MRPVLFQIGNFTFYSFGLMAALASSCRAHYRAAAPQAARRALRLRLRGHHRRRRRRLRRGAHLLPHRELGRRQPALLEHRSSAASASCGTAASSAASSVVVAWTLIRKQLGVVANAMGPAVALGYAIGRVGCQLAGDGDYGKPSAAVGDGLPARHRADAARRARAAHAHLRDPHHDSCSSGCSGAWPRDRAGLVRFGWFLVLSAVERFPIEFLRRNPIWLAGLTQPQWLALASFVIGVALVLVFGKRPAERLTP
jgi:prolipoprotein diacylglyceryltransferase